MPRRIAVFTKNRVNPGYQGARIGADRTAARFGVVTSHYVPVRPDDVDEQIAAHGGMLINENAAAREGAGAGAGLGREEIEIARGVALASGVRDR